VQTGSGEKNILATSTDINICGFCDKRVLINYCKFMDVAYFDVSCSVGVVHLYGCVKLILRLCS
jgi:hypothetical protein